MSSSNSSLPHLNALAARESDDLVVFAYFRTQIATKEESFVL